MSAFWVNRLNESDSRLHKEDVLRQVVESATLGDYASEVFLGLANAAYNPMVTWGIKQVPATTGITGAPNPWSQFNDLLGQLSSRRLTGGAARDAVKAISGEFDSVEWNTFCAAVLRKDLRAGISEKTINKICKGTRWEVPVFTCQLATSCEDRPEMVGLKRLEPKLDGVRMLVVCAISEDGTKLTTCYSRNGKIFENFGHIECQIQDKLPLLANKIGGGSFVLDGEVVGQSFQALMRQARRKENVQAGDSVFYIFDLIPLVDFLKGVCRTPLEKRLATLDKCASTIADMANVRLLPHLVVNLDTAAGKDQFKRYSADAVEDGFEGIMIKDLTGPYQCKRTTHWLKWKPVITVDLEVVDVEAGTGRNVGRLGALVCSGTDLGKQITVNCGSGFTDSDRDSLWADRSMVVGRTVEILCDAVTQNQDGTYSLRFPRFVRFRDDK